MTLPMITTMATLSLGLPTSAPEQNIYVHGSNDIYVSEHVSLRGDVFYYAGEQNQSGRMKDNHSLFSGVSYHFTDGQFDPYVTFQPGLALTRSNIGSGDRTSDLKVTPLVAGGAGARFFVSPQFHFFAEGRHVLGRHLSDAPRAVPLSETRVSFGLGLQLKSTRGKR